MQKPDIDRICTATLLGRFGSGVISPWKIEDLMCASDPTADAAATIRNAAVWTTARSGFVQGKH